MYWWLNTFNLVWVFVIFHVRLILYARAFNTKQQRSTNTVCTHNAAQNSIFYVQMHSILMFILYTDLAKHSLWFSYMLSVWPDESNNKKFPNYNCIKRRKVKCIYVFGAWYDSIFFFQNITKFVQFPTSS